MSTIKFRRGTAAEWKVANPILASGEPGFEKDTGKQKIGDGETAWLSLPYFIDEDAVAAQIKAGLAAGPGSAPASDDAAFPVPVRTGKALINRPDTGLPTIYWPWAIDVRHVSGRLGDYYLYYSTDHDSSGTGAGFNGKGGLGMAYADHPEGPWTVHKTRGKPVIYQDTTVGDQTETPSVIWNDQTNRFHIYYQQQHTGLNQSTLLMTSPSGLLNDPDNKRIGLVIQGVPNRSGDGQISYLYPLRLGNSWHGSHLLGGGDFGRQAWSSSNDGIHWVTDPRAVSRNTDIVSDPNSLYMSVSARIFRWRGRLWAMGGEARYASGFIPPVSGQSTWMLLQMRDDLVTFTGGPFRVVMNSIAGEPSRQTPVSFVSRDGVTYAYYRAAGAYGHIACATIGA